jgi:phosphate transport system protein
MFDREMTRLQHEVITLGRMVEEAVAQSMEDLKRHDGEAARRMIEADALLNEKRFTIENDALMLIATQQPMAGDLRLIAAIIVIAMELERIGDYAKGIAKINLMIGEEPFVKPLVDLPRMARTACDMLHRAMEAFEQQDAAAARAIPATDEEIDELYNQVYRELLTYILSNGQSIEQANHLLWAAHNLERVADRVINICERILFSITGEMTELDGSEGRELGLKPSLQT